MHLKMPKPTKSELIMMLLNQWDPAHGADKDFRFYQVEAEEIAQDGLSVLDDVGGLFGYCEFPKGTYGDGEYDGPFDYGNKEDTPAASKPSR